ncbi:MAG: metal-dependent hydrolase [Betaproteobacteria bacterium]|nr:metal-dependent hydrolase [Betaproteobacteria bacterium]
MHPIPVRTMKFDVPSAADFHPLYIAGNSVLSYQHTAFGLYAALVEPFVVKSLRRTLERIRDDKLREELDRYCRQESQHYQRHVDFNKVVLEHGYPGLEERLARLRAELDGFLRDGGDQERFCVGYTEGFESYTTQFALRMIESGLYDHKRTHPAFGSLFKWHMLEEIEHRNVAFDVYQHLYGGYLYRVRMCWFTQGHMLRFQDECAMLMSAIDVPRYGERCRITPRQRLQIALFPVGMRLRSMLPGYSPHNYRVPDGIARLSAQFTALAESVR